MRLYTVLLYFLQTAVHVSDDTLIHHQERIQTVITTSGTGRTVFATIRWREWVETPTSPRQRMVANMVRAVPDVLITVWMCSWWWMKVSSEICTAICRKYNKTLYSRILLDNYWQWFTMHGPMNIKFYLVYLATILSYYLPHTRGLFWSWHDTSSLPQSTRSYSKCT